jgi:hypothetical protein
MMSRLPYVVVVLVCSFIAAAEVVAAPGSHNWKLYSYSQLDSDPLGMFYDAASVRRTVSGHIQVWARALPLKRLGSMGAGTQDMPRVPFLETIANKEAIVPVVTFLEELDCSRQLQRDLSFSMNHDVNEQPSDWKPVFSGSSEEDLLRLMCAAK